MNEHTFKKTFDFFNTGKSGKITKSDLKIIFKNLSTEKIEDIIQEVDLDCDNMISYDEFKNMMIHIGTFGNNIKFHRSFR